MSFNQNTDVFVSVSVNLKCQILLQGISDVTKIDIYYVVTIGNSEKKSSLIQLQISFYNEDYGSLLKWLKETKIITKT